MSLNLRGETDKPPGFVSGVSVAQLSCCKGGGAKSDQHSTAPAHTGDIHGGYREDKDGGMKREGIAP
jgi:hypothetical protein